MMMQQGIVIHMQTCNRNSNSLGCIWEVCTFLFMRILRARTSGTGGLFKIGICTVRNNSYFLGTPTCDRDLSFDLSKQLGIHKR